MSGGTSSGPAQARTQKIDLSWHEADHGKAPKGKRDWKRMLLLIGLGGLSWVATYVGMLELIEANVGDLPFLHKAIIGFSVAMLMVMVVWLLDQIFSEIGFITRLLFVAGYAFLTLISVGFGFGFYWKVLESRGESSRSAEAAVGQVQNALHAGVTRLEQLQRTLDALTLISAEKAQLERTSGTSCPNSRPGDGPRRQLREDDASRFKFAADFVRTRVGSIKGELGGLNGALGKVMSNDASTMSAATGTRNDFMRGLNRNLDMTVTGFNAFRSDPQLKQIRSDLGERADKSSFPDTKGGTFQCPDVQLAAALKGVVRAIDELPLLEKPTIAAVEGSEAVIEAFRRLSASLFGALTFKLPPSPEELRELQKKAVQSVEGGAQAQARLTALSGQAGLSNRDYIPLAIALFVDLCLLLVSIKRQGSALERLVPKMRAAERGPVIQILSRFNEIHRDPVIRENFEVFRHVVFDFHGDYYAAVPLNTPYRPNPRNGRQAQGYGVSDAEALMQEAHLLVNLFASFEKDRIFTRVMSPLLSTSAVQKRLRRQGSKFANAEAFRVYRFRNGAWSEIILGAVMGAAQRVEAADRRRRVEEDLFGATGSDRVQQPFAPDDAGAHGGRPGDPRRTAASAGVAGAGGRSEVPVRPPFMPRVVPFHGETGAGDSRRPANSNTAPFAPSDNAGAFGAFVPGGKGATRPDVTEFDLSEAENVVLHPAVSRPMPPRSMPEPVREPEPPASSGWGNVASTPSTPSEMPTPPGHPQGSLHVPAPSINPRAPTGLEAVAYRLDVEVPPPAEPMVTVAATRETMTFTLPVSEAWLPPSLLARVQMPPVTTDDRVIDAEVVSPAGALPPPPKPSLGIAAEPVSVPATHAGGTDLGSDERTGLDQVAGSDEARAMALRFGPATREA